MTIVIARRKLQHRRKIVYQGDGKSYNTDPMLLLWDRVTWSRVEAKRVTSSIPCSDEDKTLLPRSRALQAAHKSKVETFCYSSQGSSTQRREYSCNGSTIEKIHTQQSMMLLSYKQSERQAVCKYFDSIIDLSNVLASPTGPANGASKEDSLMNNLWVEIIDGIADKGCFSIEHNLNAGSRLPIRNPVTDRGLQGFAVDDRKVLNF